MEESRVAELAELRVMLRVDAAHGLHHLFAQFHRRRQRLGIPSEDVAEIDVKEFARFGQHQVIKMTVADAQQVRDDTIASYPDGQDRTHREIVKLMNDDEERESGPLTATADVAVHHFGSDAVRPAFRRMVLAEKVQDRSFSVAHFPHRNAVDVLDESWNGEKAAAMESIESRHTHTTHSINGPCLDDVARTR